MNRRIVLGVVFVLVGCATSGAPASSPASREPPAPVSAEPVATDAPADADAIAVAGPPWREPLPHLSLDALTPDERDAVTRCIGAHDVTAADVSPEELLDAAGCLREARAWGREILMYREVVTKYPTSAQAIVALREMGARYEQIEQLARAAEVYREYLAKYPKQEDARALGQRAACLAWSLSDDAGAQATVADLERLYGRKGFVAPTSGELPGLCE